MKVMLYCQYLLGVGHLFRTLRLASGLHEHEVVLVLGGPVFELNVPKHVRVVRQPPLSSDEKFSHLIAEPGYDLEQIKQERKKQLLELLKDFRPDVLVVELYPFGRSMFQFELDPCIELAHSGECGPVRVVCSVRDILSVRTAQAAWEEKIIGRLDGRFDAILVHGDPTVVPMDRTFTRMDEIMCPVLYTGYVASTASPALLEEGAGERTVVAGLGGGRTGHELASSLVDVFAHPSMRNVRLLLFPGPLAGEKWVESIQRRSARLKAVTIMDYVPHFNRYVASADAVVSLGGYNTCVEILSSGVPALVHPWKDSPEQQLRCQIFAQRGFLTLLDQNNLMHQLRGLLDAKRPEKKSLGVDLEGVKNTARLLKVIVQGDI